MPAAFSFERREKIEEALRNALQAFSLPDAIRSDKVAEARHVLMYRIRNEEFLRREHVESAHSEFRKAWVDLCEIIERPRTRQLPGRVKPIQARLSQVAERLSTGGGLQWLRDLERMEGESWSSPPHGQIFSYSSSEPKAIRDGISYFETIAQAQECFEELKTEIVRLAG
ncbi:hypothetical protein [Actinoplanes xinjiangensis]|uniref:hypothetical protein n=1 Tax=Actinoplanes xinjiangensis TaxID=512350 RepID=UPI00342B0F1D